MRTFGNSVRYDYGQYNFTGNATTGVAFAITGVAGAIFSAQALQVASPNVAGQSNGIRVIAGTNATDTCQVWTNAANNTNFWVMDGTGALSSSGQTSQGLGSLNTGTLYIQGTQIYAGSPINQQSANYTVQASDNGKVIAGTNASPITFTIPTGLPLGFIVSFVANGTAGFNIANNGTQYKAGAGTTGTRTLAAFGIATATQCYGANSWNIGGTGLS